MTERKPAHNSTYPKGGGSCSKDSFVVNQTLVFQIKFCGKSPALRVAAKRYSQCLKTDRPNIKRQTKCQPHIQAHLVAPTHGRPLRNQKSLNFATTRQR
jgi:hypothetical protein